ncbi:MAG: hypothetical protein J6H31_09950 [Butyrivibrio sp.]|nr:hypothetical protein [Butyrivibrio sp.]
MNRFDHSWQSFIIPATLFMTVSLSSVPGIPAMPSNPVKYWDKFDNSQAEYDKDWAGKNESLRTLTQIQNFECDWDGNGGAIIPNDVILFARNIVMSLDCQPEIYPTKRKTVQMQYELADKSYLEFEIYADRIEMLMVPRRKYNDAIERTIKADNYYILNDIVKDFNVS